MIIEESKMVSEKYEGDGNGESVLSGFGSSSGSSTEETTDQEEFLAELTRKMTPTMLQENDEKVSSSLLPNTKPESTQIYSNQNQSKKYRHQHEQQRMVKGYNKSGGFPLQNGSGMRVVFLGGSGPKSGSLSSSSSSSSGTGVFIPHGTNNLTTDHQTRKKSGCSTVLIPERVLLSLKQHFDKRNASAADVKQHLDKRNATTADDQENQDQKLEMQEKSNKTVEESTHDYEELRLPQEWTY